ncbi:MAG: hypothetical protein GY811_01140 [Myxococcales bacterium]|nr:hypothetical protein [Myxococcales bacterium]
MRNTALLVVPIVLLALFGEALVTRARASQACDTQAEARPVPVDPTCQVGLGGITFNAETPDGRASFSSALVGA